LLVVYRCGPGSTTGPRRAAADRLDVRIGGGATVVRSCDAAGLVDYMHLVQLPIVLGRGVRIRDGLDALEDAFDVEDAWVSAGRATR
jgi:dihydrofolate reductase